MQLSTNWLKMVIASLRLLNGYSEEANFIEASFIDGSLTLGLVFIELENQKMNILPMALQD